MDPKILRRAVKAIAATDFAQLTGTKATVEWLARRMDALFGSGGGDQREREIARFHLIALSVPAEGMGRAGSSFEDILMRAIEDTRVRLPPPLPSERDEAWTTAYSAAIVACAKPNFSDF